ncbi:MAG TPA: HDIG domain-containing protein [Firmicutes bacterium]|nr:HDIG domain-containing protein [Bacillota bacterium]
MELTEKLKKYLAFKSSFLNNRKLQLGFVVLVLFAMVYTILAITITPNRVALEEGKPSPQTIYAPKETIDWYTTNLLRDDAAKSIPETYDFDPEILPQAEERLENFFAAVAAARAEEDAEAGIEKLKDYVASEEFALDSELQVALLDEKNEDLTKLKETLQIILQNTLEQGIKATGVENARRQALAELERWHPEAPFYSTGEAILEVLIKPNLIYNASVTTRAREEARQSVEPVRIMKGALIVSEGQQVTSIHIAQLEALGLQRTSTDYVTFSGLFIVLLVLFLLIGIYFYLYDKEVLEKPSYLLLYGLIVIFTLLFSAAGNMFSGYFLPVAAGIILITILFNVSLALVSGIVFGIFAVLMTGGVRFVIVSLLGGLAAVYGVHKVNRRDDVAKAGLYVACINAAAIVGIFLFTGSVKLEYDFIREFAIGVMAGIGNGLFSSVVAIGMLPFLESGFGLTTSITFLELANPNQKLLKRLLREAPGTYHHSIIVANLAEAAAEAVNADPLLARVGAYYHDIGKLRRPYFFSENQLAQNNPHEKISANLSKLIITSHIKDGVELGRKEKLPQSILDIIQQHHGTSLVSYFYVRATEGCTERDKVEESSFRYEGPKPRSKEAAIVHLADAVEASVRSMVKPSPSKVDGMVKKIIKDRLNDGQLDESDLTLREVDVITATFIHILSGIFHTRIEYPEKDFKEMAGGLNGASY